MREIVNLVRNEYMNYWKDSISKRKNESYTQYADLCSKPGLGTGSAPTLEIWDFDRFLNLVGFGLEQGSNFLYSDSWESFFKIWAWDWGTFVDPYSESSVMTQVLAKNNW